MKTYYNLHIDRDTITSNGLSPIAGKGIFTLTPKTNEYYMGFSKSWELSEKDIDSLKLPEIKPGKTFTINGKKIYRYPNLTLPRQKVDILKEKEDIKIVRDPNKADIHVISYKFLRNLFSFRWEKAISFIDFFNIMKEAIAKGLVNQEVIDELKEIIKNADKDSYISYDRHYSYGNNQSQSDWYEAFYKLFEPYKKDYNKVIILEEKNKSDFETFINTNSEIVFDVDVLDIIDSELAVLSNDQYENIENMLTSSDKDNRSLAVEMIANCNIEKSFNVVSGLYWWYYEFFKDSNNWTSVNVKSFRTRMKDYEGGHNTSNMFAFNQYIKNLAKDGKLTRFAIDKTRNLLMNTMLKDICGKSNEIFKVDLENLYIADEIEEMINE